MDIKILLRNKGYRITSERQYILEAVTKHPLTVQEIYNRLQKKKLNVDLASVYRNLELFTNLKIIQVIEIKEGKKRYELINEDNHHHHLVCNSCGKIEDIEIKEEKKLLSKVKVKSYFKIENHSLEFFGLCTNCQ